MLQTYYEKHEIERAYEVFRARGFSADWVISGVKNQDVAMASLPPFLRTLLVTDGTVTKSLEAFYWEPIVIDSVSQKLVAAEAAIHWLDIAVGDEVLGRRVNLRGRFSNSVYARAFSIIRPQLIPDDLRQRLIQGTLGIGELIRDCGIETYRELLEIGSSQALAGFGDEPDTTEAHIFRTYRIVLNKQPAILVTENFPISVFRAEP